MKVKGNEHRISRSFVQAQILAYLKDSRALEEKPGGDGFYILFNAIDGKKFYTQSWDTACEIAFHGTFKGVEVGP